MRAAFCLCVCFGWHDERLACLLQKKEDTRVNDGRGGGGLGL
jgi:hypothetical protein